MRFWPWLLILLLFGCTREAAVVEQPQNVGDLLEFTFQAVNLTRDDSIIITGVNTSKTVYLHAFCDVPFGVLEKRDNHFTWVYPPRNQCSPEQNATFEPGTEVKISDLGIGPGTYRLKLIYSTLGHGEYMREYNQEITVS